MKTTLALHLASQHVYNESKCQICKKIYANPRKLKNHVFNVHSSATRFECSICELQLKNYKNLHLHVEKRHSFKKHEVSSTCDICGISYYSKLKLENHMKFEHTGSIACFDKKCNRKFYNINATKKHFLVFHNRDFKVIFYIDIYCFI